MISLVWINSSAPTALAWDEGPGGRNEIGDRQFIAGVFDVLNPSSTSYLAIGCTESLFEIKIASEGSFDDSYKARIRYDSKKALNWSINRAQLDFASSNARSVASYNLNSIHTTACNGSL